MANITLTDTNPEISKAAGGGGLELAALTDTSPAIGKAAGGGGREHIWLYDHPPVLWESHAQAGLNPLFKGMLDND